MAIDYTGQVQKYTDTTAPREISQQETVAGQMEGLLSKESPYITQARTRAKEEAAGRGLLNTSMAVQSGEAAAIDRAMPIAQADAATYAQSGMSAQQAREGMKATGLGAELDTTSKTGLLGTEYGLKGTLSAQEFGQQGQLSAQDFGQQSQLLSQGSEQKQTEMRVGDELATGQAKLQSGLRKEEIAVTGTEERKTSAQESQQRLGETDFEYEKRKEIIGRETEQSLTIDNNKFENDKDMLIEDYAQKNNLSTEDAKRSVEFLMEQFKQQKGLTKYEAQLELEKMAKQSGYNIAEAINQGVIDEAKAAKQNEYDESMFALQAGLSKELQELANSGNIDVANIDERVKKYVADTNSASSKYTSDMNYLSSIDSTRMTVSGSIGINAMNLESNENVQNAKISAEKATAMGTFVTDQTNLLTGYVNNILAMPSIENGGEYTWQDKIDMINGRVEEVEKAINAQAKILQVGSYYEDPLDSGDYMAKYFPDEFKRGWNYGKAGKDWYDEGGADAGSSWNTATSGGSAGGVNNTGGVNNSGGITMTSEAGGGSGDYIPGQTVSGGLLTQDYLKGLQNTGNTPAATTPQTSVNTPEVVTPQTGVNTTNTNIDNASGMKFTLPQKEETTPVAPPTETNNTNINPNNVTITPEGGRPGDKVVIDGQRYEITPDGGLIHDSK